MRRTRLPPRALVGLGILGLTLGLYIATLAPGLTWRNDSADGGELIATAWTLGVAHPPGYPTYLLLARGFASLVPTPDVAYRFNLFSALTGALAVLLLFLLLDGVLRRLSPSGVSPRGRLLVAGAASLTLATSPVLWSQATVTEVYALNALFFTGILALSARLLGSPRPLLARAAHEAVAKGSEPPATASPSSPRGSESRLQAAVPQRLIGAGTAVVGSHRGRLYLAALLLGLGLGNHATLGFLIPVLGWLYLTSRHRGWVSSLVLATIFLLGLAVYLYLPIRASADPPINWGQANTWEGFRGLVSAAPYRNLVFGIGLEEILPRLAAWARLLVEQFTVVGVGVGLLGLRLPLERWPRLLGATAAVGLLYSVYAIGYKTADSYVYLIPFFVLFTLWMGVGWWGAVTVALPRVLPSSRWSPWAVRGLLALAIAIPVFNVATNYRELDLSRDVGAQEYASSVFQELEEGALVLATTDAHIFSLWYQRYVEAPDSQVLVVASHLLQFQWYWEGLRRRHPERLPPGDPGSYEPRLTALVEANLARGPVYLTYQDAALEERYELVERGVVYRVSTEHK